MGTGKGDQRHFRPDARRRLVRAAAQLVSSVAAFCLVLALLVVGVLAVPQATINMGGSITFDATDVVGSVSVATDGAATDLVAGENTVSFDAEDTSINFSDFESLNLVFVKDQAITLTITVTNAATDRPMYIKFTKLPVAGGTDVAEITISSATYGAESTKVALNTPITVAQNSGTVEIKFTISASAEAFNNSIDATWSCAFDLSNTAE